MTVDKRTQLVDLVRQMITPVLDSPFENTSNRFTDSQLFVGACAAHQLCTSIYSHNVASVKLTDKQFHFNKRKQACECDVVTVSYTHLTLPTKRIV